MLDSMIKQEKGIVDDMPIYDDLTDIKPKYVVIKMYSVLSTKRYSKEIQYLEKFIFVVSSDQLSKKQSVKSTTNRFQGKERANGGRQHAS